MSDLTLKEQKHVRVALRYLRRRSGGWKGLSKVLHYGAGTLEKVVNGRRGVTARMAFIVSRLVEIPLDDLLAGKFTPEGTCPHCGMAPDFSDEATVEEDGPRPLDGLKLVR